MSCSCMLFGFGLFCVFGSFILFAKGDTKRAATILILGLMIVGGFYAYWLWEDRNKPHH